MTIIFSQELEAARSRALASGGRPPRAVEVRLCTGSRSQWPSGATGATSLLGISREVLGTHRRSKENHRKTYWKSKTMFGQFLWKICLNK